MSMLKKVLIFWLISFLLVACVANVKYNGDPDKLGAGKAVDEKGKQSLSNPLYVTESDEYHIVRRGENLFQISKASGVKIKKLKLYNNLIDDEIFLGQKIYLKPNLAVYPKYITKVDIPPEKFHTVSAGETLADISHKYGVFILDLVDFNGLSGMQVSQGQKLWLVDGKLQPKSELAKKEVRVIRPQRKKVKTVVKPTRVQRTAKIPSVASTKGGTLIRAKKPTVAAPAKIKKPMTKTISQGKPQHSGLKFPVEGGRIISNFGKKGFTINKGVNIAGKEGEAVRAALAGKVIFAGEQRGYGKVIVVEHDKFVMTVYAHNKVNLVRSGDKVTAGQPIAKLGKSGRVTTAQLHFEYRVKGKAVDPLRVLAKI